MRFTKGDENGPGMAVPDEFTGTVTLGLSDWLAITAALEGEGPGSWSGRLAVLGMMASAQLAEQHPDEPAFEERRRGHPTPSEMAEQMER